MTFMINHESFVVVELRFKLATLDLPSDAELTVLLSPGDIQPHLIYVNVHMSVEIYMPTNIYDAYQLTYINVHMSSQMTHTG